MNGKEMTGSVAPDQAHFSTEVFLSQTLPNFESKIILHMPMNKQQDGPMLFLLLEQCFQEVGLHCPDKDHKTYKNLLKCQRNYLEALASFLNVSDQLIRWFCTAKKPSLMPVHDHMHC